ncbi:toxin-antitoxin system YwqK family antitoxin [Larkinella insperata]|uniref:Toxin-antitoxin system YwqK family antitoxin n=1 Tax=Larkinella insperata TaxID=332158 RepID=A0ABW3QAN4_9BACT|nr:hypothetical protein [Larkinella insperata]
MSSFYLICLAGALLASPGDETKKNRRLKNRFERQEYLNSVQEITYHDRWKKMATVQTFDKANRRLSEEHYRDYQQRIRHGRTRSWFPNGQLHWTCDFKDNQINGPFFSYYEDGTLKRRELYRLGQVRRKGECFTANGEPTPCQPLVQQAEFEGGPKKFVQFLKGRLRQIQSPEPSIFITLEGTLSESGILYNLRPMSYLKNRPESEQKLASQLVENLRDMPQWRPLVIDDQATQSDLLISIHLYGGRVYSANYGYNTM